LTVLPLDGGHAVLVDAAGRKNDWLVNCGNENAAEFTLKPFLRAQGVNKIPRLVLTEGNSLNTGGAESLDEDFGIGELVTGPVLFRSSVYRKVIADFEKSPARHRIVDRGDAVGCWQVLHPGAGENFARADDAALVLLGNFYKTHILLLSDLGRNGQSALLANTNDLRADIVIAGLPDAGETLCDALLDAIQPKIIVIADSEFPATRRQPRIETEIVRTKCAGDLHAHRRRGENGDATGRLGTTYDGWADLCVSQVVGADVRRLIIFDSQYTICAHVAVVEGPVNRKSHIINPVRASSPRLLQFFRQADVHVARVREREFLHFNRYALRLELGQDHVRDVGGEFFDEFPTMAFAEFQQPLADGEIINCVADVIAPGRRRKIEVHFHRQQQALRLDPFRFQHADAVKDFEINDGNLHGFTIYDLRLPI
jgi:beta-lactamase superfamily II metal-dependent hydrolase